MDLCRHNDNNQSIQHCTANITISAERWGPNLDSTARFKRWVTSGISPLLRGAAVIPIHTVTPPLSPRQASSVKRRGAFSGGVGGIINNHISTTLVCRYRNRLPLLACHQSWTKGVKKGRHSAEFCKDGSGLKGGEWSVINKWWVDYAQLHLVADRYIRAGAAGTGRGRERGMGQWGHYMGGHSPC